MNLLFYGEIRHELKIPDFGEALALHLAGKRNPDVYTASLSAWSMLAEGLNRLGIANLPRVSFAEAGKPVFTDSNLHFSLSHSAGMAAALISDAPCGVDIELIREETAARLYARCLSESEQAQKLDFFSIWTKKEAIGKLSGKGLPPHPGRMEISQYAHLNWLQLPLLDGTGRKYILSAVCESPDCIKINKKGCVF